MGLGLKDAVLRIDDFHDKVNGKFNFPDDYCQPGCITVLAAYVNQQHIKKTNCNFVEDSLNYLQAINFQGALWGEDQYLQPRVRVNENYSLVTALTNVEAVDTATTSINSCIRKLTCSQRDAEGEVPQGILDLMHVIGELHDNVWSHGRSTGFSFAQRSAVPKTNREQFYLEFSLADCGLGFFKELDNAGIPNINSHKDAIEWCIKEGNSSKHADFQDEWAQQLPYDFAGSSVFGSNVAVKDKENNHQGLGLFHLMDLVKNYNGELFLATGDVCLEANGGNISYTKLHKGWPGVAISCRFKIHELASDCGRDEQDDPQVLSIMKQLAGG